MWAEDLNAIGVNPSSKLNDAGKFIFPPTIWDKASSLALGISLIAPAFQVQPDGEKMGEAANKEGGAKS